MQLLLLHYNNYFNRIIKKKDTIADYKAADAGYKEVANINFNPGDGVATSIVLGLGQTGTIFDADEEFDYLVAYETVDNKQVIDSRWFILEQDRKRGGQYELTLKRDVLADNYLAVVNSPIFLEKGFINDVNDPLLYNSESMNVNQIKQEEIPLKDETKSGWVVGYIPTDAFSKEAPQSDRVEKVVSVPTTSDITVDGLSSWSYWNYCNSNPNYKFMADTNGKRKVTVKIRSYFTIKGSLGPEAVSYVGADYTFYPNTNDSGTYNEKNSEVNHDSTDIADAPSWYNDFGPVTLAEDTLRADVCNNIFNSVRNNSSFNSNLTTILETVTPIGDTSALRRLQGKIILDTSTNIYYKINIINRYQENPVTVTSGMNAGQAILNDLNNAMTKPANLSGNYTTFTASNASTSYAIQLNQVGVSLYVELNSSRSHLNDSPYDMFCIPFSDTLKLRYGATEFTCSKTIALSMASEIARDLGSGTVYDIQLLPYCPNRSLIVNSSSPSSSLNITNAKYNLIKESSTNKPRSAVIWCTESTFQVPISTEEIVTAFSQTDDIPFNVATEKYYAIANDLTSSTSLRTLVPSSGMLVYKVNKATGDIIDQGKYSSIELSTNNYLKIYAPGDTQESPTINETFFSYNRADYYYVFWLDNTEYSGLNTRAFASQLRIAKPYSILNPSDTSIGRKLANECDVLRLVSQNYSAIFEFSAAKSGGVDGFLADCTYKPWSPYIHILPKLKGLYGDNFVAIDDARGLICGGDMSLPQLSNAWANYQLQNKTYHDVFVREIKHMDVQNDINKQGAIAQLIASPFIGGASLGAAAGQFGGMQGAVAGAIGGAVGGLATSALDLRNSLRMMEENKKFATDMYTYNLQNIQAIPTSLTKTSALTYNTRVWPFIEYYTCTDAERNALADKMKYNGMTIMKIGKLTDYLLGEDKFYKGQLIRLNIKVDSHMAYEIYNELNKGVYL